MNRLMLIVALLLALACSPPAAVAADGVAALVEQVRRESVQEARHGKERQDRFLAAQQNRRALLQAARAERDSLSREADQLRARYDANERELTARRNALAAASEELGDLFAVVRQGALAAGGVLEASMVSAQHPGRSEQLMSLGKSERTPSLDDIRAVWLAMLTEISEAGRVVRFDAAVITADGEERNGSVLRVGVHTAAMDGRFMRYLPSSDKFVELTRQPAGRFRSMVADLQAAESGMHTVPLDPSKGAILGLLVQTPGLGEQVAQGGVIGYIILALGALGLVIVVERFVALLRVRRQVTRAAKADDDNGDHPVGRLRRAVAELGVRSADVVGVTIDEHMAIEAARLNRGLTTLAVLAAVSPLLGLLGTVTGMITTFQSITLFGTGDPKLMSGGISEALVTTELGLAVAIPLVLLHSVLSGRANAVLDLLGRQASEIYARHVAA